MKLQIKPADPFELPQYNEYRARKTPPGEEASPTLVQDVLQRFPMQEPFRVHHPNLQLAAADDPHYSHRYRSWMLQTDAALAQLYRDAAVERDENMRWFKRRLAEQFASERIAFQKQLEQDEAVERRFHSSRHSALLQQQLLQAARMRDLDAASEMRQKSLTETDNLNLHRQNLADKAADDAYLQFWAHVGWTFGDLSAIARNYAFTHVRSGTPPLPPTRELVERLNKNRDDMPVATVSADTSMPINLYRDERVLTQLAQRSYMDVMHKPYKKS